MIECVTKGMTITATCKEAGISRMTHTRWEDDYEDYAICFKAAEYLREDLLDDLTEGKLIEMIRDKSWPAIKYRLDKRHPKYKQRSVSHPPARSGYSPPHP